jgi:hypothetical protein
MPGVGSSGTSPVARRRRLRPSVAGPVRPARDPAGPSSGETVFADDEDLRPRARDPLLKERL